MEETTLGGNQWLADMNRMKWEIETNDILEKEENSSQPVKVEEQMINILLKPMEIRTFVVKIAVRNV